MLVDGPTEGAAEAALLVRFGPHCERCLIGPRLRVLEQGPRLATTRNMVFKLLGARGSIIGGPADSGKLISMPATVVY